MAMESFREVNRLRRAWNAFEHLRAFARARGMTDPDAAAREAVERGHAVRMEGDIAPGAAGARREERPPSAPGRGGGPGEKKKAVRRSSSAPGKSVRSAAAGVPRRLDDRTKEQLYARAQELDIEGRSNMTKEELIAAIREKQ